MRETDRRKELETRKIFDKIIIDMYDVLKCFDRDGDGQKKWFYIYLDLYKIFTDSDCIRGRIKARLIEDYNINL